MHGSGGECAGCELKWMMYQDKHVAGGRSGGSQVVTEHECLRVCYHDRACTGVDWVLAASVGQRCWLHGRWSEKNNMQGYTGVQHYHLERRE